MIEIHKLHKSYKKNIVLQDVNLAFQPGIINGIVGKNGAGKTTLFNCISGLETYDGNIQFSDKTISKHIGYLPTNPYIMSRITGREYLQLLCNARRIINVDFNANNIFDLPLDEYAENYSTGMKKKLAFLGVLLQKNELFILDEPFNGLDIESNIMMIKIIQQLKIKQKYILISSHIFASLYEICDTISYLKNKQIDQIIDKEKFKEIEDDLGSNAEDDKFLSVMNSFSF